MTSQLENLNQNKEFLDPVSFAWEHFGVVDETDAKFFTLYKKRLQTIADHGMHELTLPEWVLWVREAMQMYFVVKQEVWNDLFALSFADVIRMWKDLYELYTEYDTEVRNMELPIITEEENLEEDLMHE
mgnify:CR=1 FL=1